MQAVAVLRGSGVGVYLSVAGLLRVCAANFVLQELLLAYFADIPCTCGCCFVLWSFGFYGGS